jgi:hypothetical protein
MHQRDAPKVDFIKKRRLIEGARPAINPRYYPIEIMLHSSRACRTRMSVTVYDQSIKNISAQRRSAPRPPCYQFAEKVKKELGLCVHFRPRRRVFCLTITPNFA